MITQKDIILEVKNLKAEVDGTEILKGLNLTIRSGEIHAIMGPNGSGKSTFSKILAGHPAYQVTAGEVIFKNTNLLDLEPEERARAGVFLAFQYPIEIAGVTNIDFLRLAYNTRRKAEGLNELDPLTFYSIVKEKLNIVKMDPHFLNRNVNEGFSGGEKKRNEILQMALLNPSLAILDETDSGLDIDALRIVAEGVNQLANPQNSIILITHYQRLLDYIIPDYIHVMQNGRILKTGGSELAKELEVKGYDWLIDENTVKK
uniref:Sulfate ABC transporter protein n=1 Tax=Cyanophora biloba TaxID=1489483 RepID=A0A2Z4HG80_9EUKA|nr:sulfate ABC transporter protein [Cyanophora biloba]AWW13796.1 sulfate ABC transporter protein [Cyanophora biloba]